MFFLSLISSHKNQGRYLHGDSYIGLAQEMTRYDETNHLSSEPNQLPVESQFEWLLSFNQHFQGD